MTTTAPEMLDRAKKLAGAANAATGTTKYSETDLSLMLNIHDTHDGIVVSWAIYLADLTTDGGHETQEDALHELEEKIGRMQAGAG